jgi:hypothetical protein
MMSNSADSRYRQDTAALRDAPRQGTATLRQGFPAQPSKKLIVTMKIMRFPCRSP